MVVQPIQLHKLELHSLPWWFPLPRVQSFTKPCSGFLHNNNSHTSLVLIAPVKTWVHQYVSCLISLATANHFLPTVFQEVFWKRKSDQMAACLNAL